MILLAEVDVAGLQEAKDAATADHAPHRLTLHSGNGRLRRQPRSSSQPRRRRVEADVPCHEAAHADSQPLHLHVSGRPHRLVCSRQDAALQWRHMGVRSPDKGVARREPRQRGGRWPIPPHKLLCWSSSLVRAKLDVHQELKRHGSKKDAKYSPTHVGSRGFPQTRGKGR